MKNKGDLILQPDKIFIPEMNFSSEGAIDNTLGKFGIGLHLDKLKTILWIEVRGKDLANTGHDVICLGHISGENLRQVVELLSDEFEE